ncbi:MAG: hypothetical protein M3373_09695 [Gemmatimonadota bacterium]|nr:hypothetical protein [Gemmatimonadota bacterium]
MRTYSLAAVAVAALALGTGTAGAQGGDFGGAEQPRAVRVGFGGGMSVPVGDAREAFENGINGQGYLLIRLGALPAVRLNLSYQRFDLKDLVTGGADAHTQIFGGTGGLTVSLLRGPIRPYVTAAVGAFNIKSVMESPGGDSDESSTQFGIDGGAGVALRLGRIDGFVEARIQNVYTDEGLVDTKSIRVIPVTFGLLF